MIIINPDDLIQTPELGIYNDNAYSAVTGKLYNVYPENSDNIQISGINFMQEGTYTEYDGDIVKYIIDFSPTKISSKKNTANDLTEWFTQNITLKLNKLHTEYSSILSISSIEFNGNFTVNEVMSNDNGLFYFAKNNKSNLPNDKSLLSYISENGYSLDLSYKESLYNANFGISDYNISEDENYWIINIVLSNESISYYFTTDIIHNGFAFTIVNILKVNQYIANSFTIKLNSTNIITEQDAISTIVINGEDGNTYNYEVNELVQNNNTITIGADTENLFNHCGNEIISTYENGLQTLRFKAKIKEYADANDEIVIDPTLGQTINSGDIVYVYIDKNGSRIPVSTYEDGNARLFQVLNSEIVYDNGYTYVECQAKEYIVEGGLYNKDGFLITEWDTLLYNGDIYIDDGIIIRANPLAMVGYLVLPETITGIGDEAFHNCNLLEGIQLSKNTTSVWGKSFFGCTKLISITTDEDNTSYSSVDGVLYNKNISNLILYPPAKSGEFIIPSTVTFIGGYAFESCTSLTNIPIPNTVKIIAPYAFNNFIGLESISIPNSVVTIGDSAFNNCDNLKQASINTTAIADMLFMNSDSLETVTIGANVTTIGQFAFNNCNALSTAIFEDPEGWKVKTLIGNTVSISTSALQNTSTSALYLRHTYVTDTWTKS